MSDLLRFKYSCFTLCPLILCFAASSASGSTDEAKKYIEQARHDIEMQSYSDAPNNLELAEVELEEVAAAEKAPLLAEIKALREQMSGQQNSVLKKKLIRELDNRLNDAKAQIGNAMYPGIAAEIRQTLGEPKNAAALGADADKYAKQLATFEKLHGRKFGEEQLIRSESQVAELKTLLDEKMKEIANPDASSYAKDSAIEELQREFAKWEERWPQLPASDARTAALKKTVGDLQAKFTEVAMAGKITDVVERLKRSWESYESDWEGYDKETTGPAWENYRREVSEKNSAFGVPKSRELVERYYSFLANRTDDEAYQEVKDAPAVKAYMDSVAKVAEQCRAKVVRNAAVLVDAAEKSKIDASNRSDFDRLEDSLRVLFVNQDGAQDGGAQALRERMVKKIHAFEDATAGAEKARTAWYDAMKQSATAKWDEVAKNFTVDETNFDPARAKKSADKIIQFTTDNLMGWRFKPGDFPFASTINGLPVAGKYSSDVRRAIEQIEQKLGRSIGDDDNDGRWTVIARVKGNYGRMMQRKQAEGDIVEKGTGSKVGTYTVEYADPVDAAIIEVLAAHCGPLCVGEGVGMAKEDGSLGSP